MRPEVVTDGLPFGEGPVWCGGGALVVTSVAEGALYRVDVETGRTARAADTGGGANGAALGADGSVLVTQNGGIDLASLGLRDDLAPLRPATPGLQHVTTDGAVRYLADVGFHAPNDLVVLPDGDVLFTDPGRFPPEGDGIGRIMRYARDGTVSVFADGFWFCNGIGLDRDGEVVVVEREGLLRVFADGSREWIVEHLGRGAGDGFCVDAMGRFYVASTVEHGVRVVDPDGRVVDFLAIDGRGLTTNCCFGGDDLRTLYATDALPGRVVAWEGLPTPGRPLTPWPGP